MRLAHLSDPHLLSLDGVRWLDYANKRWIGRVNLLLSRSRHHQVEIFDAMVDDINDLAPDHVLVTGDVTNIALEPEFVYAREHFDRIALGASGTTVIPGNHDAYVAQGAEFFAQHFADYHRGDPEWELGDGEQFPMVRVRGDLAIIGLSTSRQTPWFTAYGVVGEAQLERLATILSDPRLDGLFRVIAIHHPPAGPPSISRIRGLRDREALAAVIADCGAELVLHGHEHRDVRAELFGPDRDSIDVRGIQSASYESGVEHKRARYRIYEVAASAGQRPAIVGEELRVWNPSERSFVADGNAKDSGNLTPKPRIGYHASEAPDDDETAAGNR
jgi:3',5'-cyclic AMP phosphodiesterase CpdA